jgi:1,4-alpha-glucan branching enzyme
MKPLYRLSFSLLLMAMLSVVTTEIKAQIHPPDGLRMPGEWNGWTNNTGMGGDFDLQRIATGTLRWHTTFQYNGLTGTQEFKFVSTGGGGPWTNQWAGNIMVNINSFSNFTFGTPSEPDNQVSLTNSKWYTVNFEDQGYQSTRAIFMETSAAPVTIVSVSQDIEEPSNSEPVQINALLATSPSAEELFYLRYTTNAWQTSDAVEMTITVDVASAGIPAQPSGTTVEYYVFSTTIANPTEDFDLVTIRFNNNNGDNYSYISDQVPDCGQVVLATDPVFPLENTSLTITLNTALGNEALKNYTGDVYVHTGVITNLSNSTSDWRYVKTNWGQNTPETRLEKVIGENNLYTLSMANIRDYYGVDVSEEILQLAMVFRSDGVTPPDPGYLVHKNSDGSDFLIEVYEQSLNVKLLTPSNNSLIGSNPVISVCAEAIENNILAIYLNDDLVEMDNVSSLSILMDFEEINPGVHWIKAVAYAGSEEAKDSVAVYLPGLLNEAPLPEGLISGINYIDNETVTLVLHDPPAMKDHVFVIGDFNNWNISDEYFMNRTPDGMYFWKTITGLTPGVEYAYQYYIDTELRLADPYTHKVLDPWNDHWIPEFNYANLKPYPQGKTTGIVSVLQTAQPEYQWEVTDFILTDVRDLVIYELHIRDFVETDAIKSVMEKLDYLQDLGVNAIELMPVNEFEGNDSWGYNPSFYFATDKAYGTINDYKEFIDECHKRGMAVILDIVLNHSFSQSPLVQMYFNPAAGEYGEVTPENPWYNVFSPNPTWSWGFDFDHESIYTQEFMDRVNTFWLTEFNVDGFRFDFTKGFTNTPGEGWDYDAARINILKRMADAIWTAKPGAYVILEHLTDNSEEVELANYGMLIWGNMNHQYNEATMGWTSDLSWGLHNARGFTFHNLVSYMESHDEERLMVKNLEHGNSTNPAHDVKELETALARNEAAAAFYFLSPGPKMIWQFGELGYDFSINHCPDGSVDPDCRTSRKPIPWHDTLDYLNVSARKKLYDVYSGLIQLKKAYPVFRTTATNYSLETQLKRLHLEDGDHKVTLLGNFGVMEQSINPNFQQTGTWHEFFSGEELQVSNTSDPIMLQPGEYRLYSTERLYLDFLSLQNISVSGTIDTCFAAKQKITVAGNGTSFVVENVSAATLAAGVSIHLLPDMIVEPGAYFRAYIDETGDYCTLETNMLAKTPEKKTEQVSLVKKIIDGKSYFSIYPNPTTGMLTLELDKTASSTGVWVELYGSMGEKINIIWLTGKNEIRIDLSNQPAGVYFLQVIKDGESDFRKIIKK